MSAVAGTRAVTAVVAAAAATFAVSTAAVMGHEGKRVGAEPRHISMYVLWVNHFLTWEQIAHHFGRDHSVVGYAVNTIRARLARESEYRVLVDYIAAAKPYDRDPYDRAEALLASAQLQMDEAARLLKSLAPKRGVA